MTTTKHLCLATLFLIVVALQQVTLANEQCGNLCDADDTVQCSTRHHKKANVGQELPSQSCGFHQMPLDEGEDTITFVDMDLPNGLIKKWYSSKPVKQIGKVVFPEAVDHGENLSPNGIGNGPWNSIHICHDGKLIVKMCSNLVAQYDREYNWDLNVDTPVNWPAAKVCSQADVNLTHYMHFSKVEGCYVNPRIRGTFDIYNLDCCTAAISNVAIKFGNMPLPPNSLRCELVGSGLNVSVPDAQGHYPVVPAQGGHLRCYIAASLSDIPCNGHLDIRVDTQPLDGCYIQPGMLKDKHICWERDVFICPRADVTVTYRGEAGSATTVIGFPNGQGFSIERLCEALPSIIAQVKINDAGVHCIDFDVKLVACGKTVIKTIHVCFTGTPDQVTVTPEVLSSDTQNTFSWTYSQKTPPHDCSNGQYCADNVLDIVNDNQYAIHRSPPTTHSTLNGRFTVHNPSCLPVTISGATIKVGDTIITPADLACANSAGIVGKVIAAGASLVCTFSQAYGVPPVGALLSVAVTIQEPEVLGAEGHVTIPDLGNWHTLPPVSACSVVSIDYQRPLPAGVTLTFVGDTTSGLICDGPLPTFKAKWRSTVASAFVIFQFTITPQGGVPIVQDLNLTLCASGQQDITVSAIAFTGSRTRTCNWDFTARTLPCPPGGAFCQDNSMTLNLGNYMTVTKTSVDSNFNIAGSFVINNPSCLDAAIASITVKLGTTLLRSPDCESLTTLAAGASKVCHFEFITPQSTPITGSISVVVTLSNTGQFHSPVTATSATQVSADTYVPTSVGCGCAHIDNLIAKTVPAGITISNIVNPYSSAGACIYCTTGPILNPAITASATTTLAQGEVTFEFTMKGKTYSFVVSICGVAPAPIKVTPHCPTGENHTINKWSITPICQPCKMISCLDAWDCLDDHFAVSRTTSCEGNYFIVQGTFDVSNPSSNYCPATIKPIVTFGTAPVPDVTCLKYTLGRDESTTCTYKIATHLHLADLSQLIGIKVDTVNSLVPGAPLVTVQIEPCKLLPVEELRCIWIALRGQPYTSGQKICGNVDLTCINVTHHFDTMPNEQACFDYFVDLFDENGVRFPDVAQPGAIPVCWCPRPCGCTLTQGYWKNHMNMWAKKCALPPASCILPTTTFFHSGNTWGSVWDSCKLSGDCCVEVQGATSCYWKLAHQWCAAKLNLQSGVRDYNVMEAVNALAAWFESVPAGDSRINSKWECPADLLKWYNIIGSFNEGLLDPYVHHCSD